MIRSLTRLEAPNRLRMLLALLAVAAAAAVLAACSSSATSSTGGSTVGHQQCSRRGGRGQPEDRHDRRRDGADQRRGLHAVLVRARHAHQVQLQRHMRAELAAGEGAGHRRPGSRARSARSSDPTVRSSAASTGTRGTRSSATPPPGQAKGNGLTAGGGLWHEATTSGTAPACSSSPGSGGGGGGY